ncbi:Uncharacterised protein [Vibrio cholerae]|uniref:Uncharacterized protein n=1 Tax=Vibrio cholerae TaxID=666 RepID=A0A656ARY6_VIBCL|nr:Uncharacterised protein [Vibrio cholerae]CSD30846.1 Uncharacterised protein [Vibrio cholerae]
MHIAAVFSGKCTAIGDSRRNALHACHQWPHALAETSFAANGDRIQRRAMKSIPQTDHFKILRDMTR